MKFETGVLLAILAGILVNVAGYASNAVWVFKHINAGFTFEALVSLVGLLVAPLGVLHGIYTWF